MPADGIILDFVEVMHPRRQADELGDVIGDQRPGIVEKVFLRPDIERAALLESSSWLAISSIASKGQILEIGLVPFGGRSEDLVQRLIGGTLPPRSANGTFCIQICDQYPSVAALVILTRMPAAASCSCRATAMFGHDGSSVETWISMSIPSRISGLRQKRAGGVDILRAVEIGVILIVRPDRRVATYDTPTAKREFSRSSRSTAIRMALRTRTSSKGATSVRKAMPIQLPVGISCTL